MVGRGAFSKRAIREGSKPPRAIRGALGTGSKKAVVKRGKGKTFVKQPDPFVDTSSGLMNVPDSVARLPASGVDFGAGKGKLPKAFNRRIN